MGLVLSIVGAFWAFNGIANLLHGYWIVASDRSGLVTISADGLLLNFSVFIVPGLIMLAIGIVMAKKKAFEVEEPPA
jgi:hypothetical protein